MRTLTDEAGLLGIYRTAVRINRADEKLRGLLTSGELAVSYYSPRGQEVVAAGMMSRLRAEDYLVTTYRGIHDQIAKGIPLEPLFAELFGRVDGTCKGKGGPMHVTQPETGVMVTTGVVGSGLPIAVGLGLAAQVRGQDRVTVVCFGDGASNIGAFHEALNMAALWRLPVVFLCQNNRYAESTRYSDGTTVERIAQRAASYGIPGVTVDGNNAGEMAEAASQAVARARAGEGPTLLEAMTYRFMGHYFGDAGAYMDADEFVAAQAADPVPALRKELLRAGISTEEELTALENEEQAAVDSAAAFAKASALPGVDELRRDVYREEVVA
ncbi:thiamine pyrophosphate-dependent dehydrogenase E1 component subunit alpha [Actinomadura sp. LD22]|uniref:Thiamine pyrophosphate-dependent dehydrogenase E1 component subunit alpha n=1 Tax=Actinomadura physcomitrii TaxID=2650748 RepID=A0A6I4MPW3_9ACTN|nr:thiamine pyrophosphate-dependent dehydrogenase E1 component subunit alpha [Actinomadura physcomitrii]